MLEPEIIEGRGLLPADTDAIVVNTALAGRLAEMRVGNTVTLSIEGAEKNWRVVGLARELFSPSVGYVPLNGIQPQSPNMVNSLRLSLDHTDEDSIAAVKTTLDQNLEQQGMRARSSTSKADSRFSFDQHMVMIYIFLIVMSAIIGLVGGLGLMTSSWATR